MKNAVRIICLFLVLAPFWACGKKRVIDPAPPPTPSQPQPSSSAPSPEPAPPEPPETNPDAPAESAPDSDTPPIDYLAEAEECYLGESYDKAMDHYQTFLDQNPQSPRRGHAHFRMGMITASKGDYAQALKKFEDARREATDAETRVQSDLLIELLKSASKDAAEKDTLKQTLNEIMKKLDS